MDTASIVVVRGYKRPIMRVAELTDAAKPPTTYAADFPRWSAKDNRSHCDVANPLAAPRRWFSLNRPRLTVRDSTTPMLIRCPTIAYVRCHRRHCLRGLVAGCSWVLLGNRAIDRRLAHTLAGTIDSAFTPTFPCDPRCGLRAGDVGSAAVHPPDPVARTDGGARFMSSCSQTDPRTKAI